MLHINSSPWNVPKALPITLPHCRLKTDKEAAEGSHSFTSMKKSKKSGPNNKACHQAKKVQRKVEIQLASLSGQAEPSTTQPWTLDADMLSNVLLVDGTWVGFENGL